MCLYMHACVRMRSSPGGASGKEPACRRRKRCGFDPWVRRIPWRRKRQPIPIILPGESHGQKSLAGYSPQGCKESDTTKQLHSCECMSLSANAPVPSAPALHMFSVSVSLFLLNIKAHLYHFGGFHIGTTLCNVGFTLSE